MAPAVPVRAECQQRRFACPVQRSGQLQAVNRCRPIAYRPTRRMRADCSQAAFRLALARLLAMAVLPGRAEMQARQSPRPVALAIDPSPTVRADLAELAVSLRAASPPGPAPVRALALVLARARELAREQERAREPVP